MIGNPSLFARFCSLFARTPRRKSPRIVTVTAMRVSSRRQPAPRLGRGLVALEAPTAYAYRSVK